MALEKPKRTVCNALTTNYKNIMKINYVNALAGSGKTQSAIKYALQQASQGTKIAIVQPSTDLLDQTYNDLRNHKKNIGLVPIRNLHSKNTTNVKDTVAQHLRGARPEVGEILLISHQTFLSLPHWNRSHLWEIIIDEVPQIEDTWSEPLPYNHASLTDYIQLHRNGKEYCPIRIADNPEAEAEIQRMAECRLQDKQDKIYQPVCQKLVASKNWLTYTNVKAWDRIVANEELGKHQLTTFSIMQPERIISNFKAVTVMGAMFTHSVMYLLWQDKVTFVEHEEITKGMENHSGVHSNGHLLTIKYFLDNKWSKTAKSKMIDGLSLVNSIKQKVEDLMGDARYLYATNNDDKQGLDFGIKVPNVCHGMNKYRKINNVVFLSALNPTTANFNFMSENNVTQEDLRKARGHQTLYQTVMRSSLRDLGNVEPKTVIVMDKESAEYLSAYFPGCVVEQVQDAPHLAKKQAGRPKSGVRKTQAEIQREYRARKKAEKLANKGD